MVALHDVAAWVGVPLKVQEMLGSLHLESVHCVTDDMHVCGGCK